LRRMKPVAVQKEITLKYELQELSVFGHAESLTNLWVILIDNAIKYSPEKSTITIQSLKKDSSAIVSIQDQGIGIEPKELHHIFDRFYRANSARSKNGAGGYGLGLSIAKKIVDQHKGQIYAKSTPNEGTTFVVKLGVK
jgi:two-component system sensor histidine kinase CiaH